MDVKKIILITNIPNPYRIPLFNEMSRQFISNNLQLKIIFGAKSYKRRLFEINEQEMQFEYAILKDRGHSLSADGEKTYFLYKGLSEIFNMEKPDLIIVSGFSFATMKVLFHYFIKKTPFIIWSGSISKPGSIENTIRSIQRKFIVNFASAFVAYGSMAKKYFEILGAPPQKIFIAMNTVDTTFYTEKTNAIRNKTHHSIFPTRFLYLGYLVPRKKITILMETVKRLSQKRRDFRLDLVGDGISRIELERFVNENNLADIVQFHGFRQKEELPGFFATSSALLFQTGYDIWGLVLNEAMAAGVPCISSINAGATLDLIKEDVTGFIVNFDNIQNVMDKMEWIIDHPEKVLTLGKNASEFINSHVNLNNAANGFLNAVNSIIKIK